MASNIQDEAPKFDHQHILELVQSDEKGENLDSKLRTWLVNVKNGKCYKYTTGDLFNITNVRVVVHDIIEEIFFPNWRNKTAGTSTKVESCIDLSKVTIVAPSFRQVELYAQELHKLGLEMGIPLHELVSVRRLEDCHSFETYMVIVDTAIADEVNSKKQLEIWSDDARFYSAVTRASSIAVVVGSEKMFNAPAFTGGWRGTGIFNGIEQERPKPFIIDRLQHLWSESQYSTFNTVADDVDYYEVAAVPSFDANNQPQKGILHKETRKRLDAGD